MVAFWMKVAEPEPRCFEQRGSLPPPKPQYNFSLKCFSSDDRRMTAPAARMMSLALYTGERLRKLRFLMTDNILHVNYLKMRLLRVVPK